MTLTLLLNSLGVALGALAAALIWGSLYAVAVASMGPVGRKWGWVLAALTLAMPQFLTANAWLEWTAEWRRVVGPEDAKSLMLPFTALVLGGWLWPIPFFLIYGSWQRIDTSLIEAEPLLRGRAVLRWILWPAGKNAIRQAAVLVTALALANFTVPTLFQVRVFTEAFWIRYNTQLDLAGAFAATWPLWSLPLLMAWAFGSTQATWPHPNGSLAPQLLAQRLGGPLRRFAGFSAFLVVAASLILPLTQLVLNPRTWTELSGAWAAGLRATGNSVFLASVTALGAIFTGLWASVASPNSTGNWARHLLRGFHALGWLTFLLPGVFLAAALIQGLNRPEFVGFYSSLGILALAGICRYFAPAWSAIQEARQTADPHLYQSALLMGAGWMERFRLAIWPQSGRLILGAAYAVYLLFLWDVETLILLQPPGGETLSLRIFNLLHYGHGSQVNALCVVTLGLAVLPLAIYSVLKIGSRLFVRSTGRSSWSNVNVALASAWLLAGCGESNSGLGNAVPLKSKLFSEVQVIGSRGVAPGQFNKPRSVACDLGDNLYVIDITGRVQKFDPEGRFLLQWQMPQTDIGKAKGMGLDPAGNILVVEPHYQRVNHFQSDGRLAAQWGRRGTNVGEFILPRCIAVNSFGEYYLGEYTVCERVQRFSIKADSKALGVLSGTNASTPYTVLGSWGRPGQSPGEFNRAEGIAIGPSDSVYVADSCNHRIQIFDREGRFLRTYGVAGAAAGRLSFPYDVRVERSGLQFVCEFGNSRISAFDAQDHLVETIGHAGRAPGEFANPWALCLDSHGNLYVADSQNHRVQKLIRRPRSLTAQL